MRIKKQKKIETEHRASAKVVVFRYYNKQSRIERKRRISTS